jgi:hypothetical protein
MKSTSCLRIRSSLFAHVESPHARSGCIECHGICGFEVGRARWSNIWPPISAPLSRSQLPHHHDFALLFSCLSPPLSPTTFFLSFFLARSSIFILSAISLIVSSITVPRQVGRFHCMELPSFRQALRVSFRPTPNPCDDGTLQLSPVSSPPRVRNIHSATPSAILSPSL